MTDSPFKPQFFQRQGGAPDPQFYVEPRLVVHIDDDAIAAARAAARRAIHRHVL